MINKLTLKNFRNFSDQEFLFENGKNIIVWENGLWKTNILEALSLFSWASLSGLDFENLVRDTSNFLYISADLSSWDNVSIHYDRDKKKKSYSINKKPSTKPKLKNISYTTVHFTPIIMNMMYLGPTLRRDFLDTLLKHSFPEYWDLLKKYKSILKNRNKFLKSIAQWKSLKKDIAFWDEQFINLAASIYAYRFHLTEYISGKINICDDFFWKTPKDTVFIYKTKVGKDTIKQDITEYLEKNIDRDIIIWKTNIGPHIDDFEIYVDDRALAGFASRWEVKSTIIALKLIEAEFIEYKTGQKPVLLIDDLLSELDNIHKDYLFQAIWEYQTHITTIYWDFDGDNIIKL